MTTALLALLSGLVLLAAPPPSAVAAQTEAVSSDPSDDDDPFAKKEQAVVPPLADPIKPVNKAFYHVNDKLYFWLFRPIATGYAFVLPKIARKGVRNFFSNVGTPVRLVSCLFQGDLKGTGTEAARFGVNTTIGVAGFADPAQGWLKLRKRNEDFGQTFGYWGIGPGFYITWPLLGPSSLRDTVGLPFNMALNPTTYVPGVGLVSRINNTSLSLGDYEDIKEAALDPYVAIRDGYNQHRRHAVKTWD